MNLETGPPESLDVFFLAMISAIFPVRTIRKLRRKPILNCPPAARTFLAPPVFHHNNLHVHHLIRIVFAMAVAGFVTSVRAGTSDLWGTNGELWTASGRLPDFSHAGYHCGEEPLPHPGADVSVAAFGAKGDGVTDDTQAF